jgi:glucose/arabinose dehydrogenase
MRPTARAVFRTAPNYAAIVAAVFASACAMASGDAPVASDVQVPDGFAIEVFATDLPGVRTLKFGPDGLLYAAQSDPGRIVRIDVAPAEPAPEIVVQGLNQPYGLAFFDGALYVAEEDKVIRLDGPDFTSKALVIPGLPSGGHWTREIVFGGDGMLYVSVGSSCNICEEQDPRRAAVTRYAPDGSGATVVAKGLRNAAGLAVHPTTGAIWASQNERDNLGDDLPPEEINILSDGTDFGWPYCYGDRRPNPEYADAARCASTTPPALEMQAHSAPLGMTFYTGDQFPAEWRGDLFVAFHGSWNRARKTGYQLAHVDVRDGRPVSYQPFAQGWLEGQRTEGRPVYPAVGPDGSLYLSDDEGGRIYRIRWVGP